jgi:hypothetical protein
VSIVETSHGELEARSRAVFEQLMGMLAKADPAASVPRGFSSRRSSCRSER